MSAAPAEEVVTAHLAWEAGSVGALKAVRVALERAPPAGVTGPKNAPSAVFGSLALDAKRKLVFAVDDARLWIDADLDGDLAEERPARVNAPGTAWSLDRAIPLQVPGEKNPVQAVFRVYRGATCAADHVHLQAQLHRRGVVVLEGRVRPVALLDADADLRFTSEQDKVLLDVDGDGRLDPASEGFTPGRPFRLRAAGYVASVPLASGKAVEFRRTKNAPPAPERSWKPLSLPRFSYVKSGKSFAELKERFAKERTGAPAQRYPTIREIAGLQTEEAGRFLDRLARKGSGDTDYARRNAALALGHEAYAAHAKTLLALARDLDDSQVCAQALLALHWLDHEGREALFRDALQRSSNYAVVLSAAQGLVALGKTGPVVQAAREKKPAMLRGRAYMALRYSKDGPPRDLMRAAAAGEENLVRYLALEDLAKLGLPEARTLALAAVKEQPKYLVLARIATQVLGRAGDAEAVRALAAVAIHGSASLQKTLRDELSRVRDPESVKVFATWLKAKEPKLRALAASLLAAIPQRSITDALVRRVKRERDPDALSALLEALGEHADPRVVGVLLSAARKKDPALRGAAIRALARIGPGVPRVRAFFLKLLDAPSWQDRIYALDAAGAAGDPSVLPKVLPNLDHKAWQVRHAAAGALGQLRQKDAIPPMIARLEKEEKPRVRAALAEALFLTTGMHLYDFADTWARWWRENGTGFRVPDEVPQKKPQQGSTVASFYGLPLESDRVIFVIDESGSMSAADPDGRTRLQTAVDEVLGAVGRLKARDRVNVVFFETRIHPWRRKLVPLRTTRGELERFLKARRPTGGTNLYDGLELALQDKEVDTIFLLSDGAPGSGKYVAADDIVRAVGRLNQTRRIAIHCVSVGTDSALLQRLAARNGGRYVRR